MELIRDFILHPEFHRYFSYLFFLLVVYAMRGYFWVKRDQLMRDMRGEDGRWDAVEIAFFVWIILFSTVILGSLFFGLTMPHEAWWSLDVVGIFVLGGKRAPDIIAAWKGGATIQARGSISADGTVKTEIKTEKKGGGGEADNVGIE